MGRRQRAESSLIGKLSTDNVQLTTFADSRAEKTQETRVGRSGRVHSGGRRMILARWHSKWNAAEIEYGGRWSRG